MSFSAQSNTKKANELDEVFCPRGKIGCYKIITREKKKILKAEFNKVIKTLIFTKLFQNPFPNQREIIEFSEKLQTNAKQIQNWFVYMRRADYCKDQKFVKKMKVYVLIKNNELIL